jgi:RNA polymerase sigma factor (sigma-70 family)
MRSDAELLAECRNGREEAWSDLIDKYRNLIFSIPIRYGFSRDEAADIFQAVCLDLLQVLPRLRDDRALPKWLVEVCSHKCYHRKRRLNRMVTVGDEAYFEGDREWSPDAYNLFAYAEREQILRESFALMPPRCQRLIRMMFFDEPSVRYREVAERLVISPNSVAPIRQRCLERLRSTLKEKGL